MTRLYHFSRDNCSKLSSVHSRKIDKLYAVDPDRLSAAEAFGQSPMKVTIVHSPLRSSWPPAADPEDSSCDENGNANANAGGWGAAPVAQIPDEDLRPRRHPCDTCNAASPDASCDDAATYLKR